MKKLLLFYSICAVGLITAASFTSVVGHQASNIKNQQNSSPLFAVQTQRATHQTTMAGVSTYLGQGTPTHLFPSTSSPNNDLLQTALRFFTNHPVIFTKLVANLATYPAIASLLIKYGITTEQIHSYIKVLQQHPSLIPEALTDVNQLKAVTNGPHPRGLSTSNPLGCFIVAMFALLPLTITLTLLLLFFTLRILTCMNINDCANTLAQKIWNQMIQGLIHE